MIRGLLVCVAMTAVAGCASEPAPPVDTVVLTPDRSLLRDCPVPEPARGENGRIAIGDAMQWAADLFESLSACNADKQALRRFYQEVDADDGQEG